MKGREVFILALALCAVSLNGQITLAPSVVSSGGGFYEGNNMIVSWTVGELAVTTLTGGDMILTQGFQQPEIAGVGIEPGTDTNLGITVYPNPVGNELYIRFDVVSGGRYRIEVNDVTGRLIAQTEREINPGEIIQLSTSAYTSGVYFLKVISPDHNEARVTPLRKL